MNKCIFIAIMTVILLIFPFPSHHNTVEAVILEEQIKFDVLSQTVLQKIINEQYILQYKTKTIGKYFYQDYYYDTQGLNLFKLGYSYRFRIRDKGEYELEYGLQFKKEYDKSDSANFRRTEIDDIIPRIMALKILSGKWDEAFSSSYSLKTIKEFRAFLEKNKINPNKLSPCLYGQQKRTRLTLKENSILYFEISLDEGSFRLINSGREKEVNFLQLEFENKFRKDRALMDNKEQRIRDLINFFTKNYDLKISRDSKYRMAEEEIIKK